MTHDITLKLSKHQERIIELLAGGWWIPSDGRTGIFHDDHPAKRCGVDTTWSLLEKGILRKIRHIIRERTAMSSGEGRDEFGLTEVGRQIADKLIPF